MFLKQIIFVRTPKIMIICQIHFTGPHQNFFKSFLSHYFSMADSMRAPISINLFLLKSLVFMMILLALVLPSDYLMFSVCLSVSDKNQVKIDLLSQNLYIIAANLRFFCHQKNSSIKFPILNRIFYTVSFINKYYW